MKRWKVPIQRNFFLSALEYGAPFAKLSTVNHHSNEITESIESFSSRNSIDAEPTATTSPNDPPWNVGSAVSLWVASVLLIILVPTLFLAPYAYLSAGSLDGEDLMRSLASDPVAIAIQIAAIIPAHLITLAIAFYIVTAGKRFSFFKMLGWESGGMRWFHHLAILIAFFSLIGLIGYFVPEPEHEMMKMLKSSRYAVFLVAAMAVLTAPLVEEVVYRGVLYSAIQRTAGVSTAVVVVTGLFALVHLPQYYPSVATMSVLTLLSLVLTLIRVRTNNVLPCVILHTIFNGMQAMLLIAEPYLGVEPALKEQVAAFTGLLS